jgi:hypothetical protein
VVQESSRRAVRLPSRLAAQCALLAAIASATGAQDQPGVTVDLARTLRPVTHCASGSMWGLSKTSPNDALLGGLRMVGFRQPATLDGESPGYGALEVADRVLAHHGRRVEAVLSDLLPGYPSQWPGLAEWLARVRSFAEIKCAGDRDEVWYDVWDEPDRDPPADWVALGGFPAIWKSSFTAVREADARAVIVGPSHSCWSSEAYRSLLSWMRDHDCLPDVVSWHETAGPSGIEIHLAEYRALIRELAIDERPVSINAYMSAADQGAPGPLLAYAAALERAGVAYASIAHWHDPATLGRLVSGTQPLGGYWLLKWYGELAGRMVASGPPGEGAGLPDALAALDESGRTAQVLVAGNRPSLVVRGFGAAPFLVVDGRVRVRIERAPHDGFEPVAAPLLVAERDFDVVGNVLQLTVPVDGLDAARITLSPPAERRSTDRPQVGKARTARPQARKTPPRAGSM